ncbi:MAG: diguanylate cyclase [Chitinivibrionales bacterium]|nr:diguanylate cyclase [Chitinivibrionales bacterium]
MNYSGDTSMLSATSSAGSILIVNEDNQVCDLLKHLLSSSNRLEFCRSVEMALGLISQNSYDLIIAELNCQYQFSASTILTLAREKDRGIGFLLMASSIKPDESLAMLRLGVTGFHKIPFDSAELVADVEKIVAFQKSRTLLRSDIESEGRVSAIGHASSVENTEAVSPVSPLDSLHGFYHNLQSTASISEIMQLLMTEINNRFEALFTVIGINYVNHTELFAMPRYGNLRSDTVITSIIDSWDDSFKVFMKEDFKHDQVSLYMYRGGQAQSAASEQQYLYNSLQSMELKAGGEVFGFCAFFQKLTQPLSVVEQMLFSLITSYAASLIRSCYLQLVLKQQSRIDSLTGLGNRWMFSEFLDRALSIAARTGQQLCCCLIDIDDFNAITLQYGHLVGDAVLISCSRTIAGMIRRGDCVYRFEGSKFALLLPNTQPSGATQLAQRICTEIEQKPFVCGEVHLKLTISIGLVHCQQTDAKTKEAIIHDLHQSVAEAKRAGKNRIVWCQE